MPSARPPLALDDHERLAALRLARTERVGPALFAKLMARYGSASSALEALPGLAGEVGLKSVRIATRAAAERELDALDRLGGVLIVRGEPAYPAALAALADAPAVLSCVGDVDCLAGHGVAIVGARAASLGGRKLAEQMAADLAAAGWVVVSGLARGIDSAAHLGALGAAGEEPATVAVMAGGLDRLYPPENAELLARICDRGAAVSEVALGTAPTARHFPRRNRIIAGLCVGVVVVEAALKSGSLITARLAADQGREVMAVPGSPLDERCRGSNSLIRDGAALVESADDVLAVLPAWPTGLIAPRGAPRADVGSVRLSPDMPPPSVVMPVACGDGEPDHVRDHVMALLATAPTPVDDLIRRCAVPAAVVTEVLMELELTGRLERHPGNAVSLA